MDFDLIPFLVGIGLSAACGFRVFVPLLVMGLAYQSGNLNLTEGFEWIGSTPAIITFGVATVLEIGAYYIPWLDNLLDSIATPAALIAGTIVTASFVGDVSPWLKWSLAAIAGGGTAATVQIGTVLTRGASTLTTGGMGNPIVSTAEMGGSLGMSLLAIALPVLAVVLVVGLIVFVVMKRWRRKRSTGRRTAVSS